MTELAKLTWELEIEQAFADAGQPLPEVRYDHPSGVYIDDVFILVCVGDEPWRFFQLGDPGGADTSLRAAIDKAVQKISRRKKR